MDPASASIIERLGVAGILVVAAYFLLKYFMSEIAKKDQQLTDQTKQFISTTERFATISERSLTTMENVRESVDGLTDEFRRALGNAIVGAATEAIRGAKEIAEGQRRAGGGNIGGTK